MDVAPVLERVLGDRRVARIMAILDTFGKAPGGLLANGLAFSTLFASIPTLLLALGLAGLIADHATVEKITDALIKAFPPLTDIIESSMVAVSQGAAITGLIGLLGVLWTVSQLYVTLDVAFSRIFAAAPERDLVRRTARGFVWVAILAAVIIGLIVLASMATTIDAILPGTFPFAATITRVLGSQAFLLAAAIAASAISAAVRPGNAGQGKPHTSEKRVDCGSSRPGAQPTSAPPCTPEWPRMGMRPVFSRPTQPRASPTLTRAWMVSTPCACCVRPMDQTITPFFAEARRRANLSISARVVPLSRSSINAVMIQLFWFRRVRDNVALLFVLSLFVNVGMWLERFIIIVTSLHRDFLPSSWDNYVPTRWDFAMFAGTIGLFLSLFFLFIRFLPALAMFEMRTIVPQAKLQPDNHG